MASLTDLSRLDTMLTSKAKLCYKHPCESFEDIKRETIHETRRDGQQHGGHGTTVL